MVIPDRKTENGWVMPLTLMVLFVLMMLGTSLWHYSMADIRQVSLEAQKMQAYYHARSGAELLALKVDFNTENGPILKTTGADILLPGQESPLESTQVLFGDEALDLEIQLYTDNGDIIILSTGRVNHLSETLKLTIKRSGADRIIFWERGP